jgi:hypothetical protein
MEDMSLQCPWESVEVDLLVLAAACEKLDIYDLQKSPSHHMYETNLHKDPAILPLSLHLPSMDSQQTMFDGRNVTSMPMGVGWS